MGEGALTKEQLDAANAEWLAWRKERDAPVAPKPAAKALRTAPALSQHDAALIKGIASAFKASAASVLNVSSMTYLGVHQSSMAYRKGHVVTFDGSAWCATRDVSVEKPGHGDGWQLMVKHGKDAPAASPRSDAAAASPRSDAAAASPRANGHLHPNPRMR